MKKVFFIIIFFLLIGTIQAYAASPVIFYSDLTSGPKTSGQNNKGVFVTIWGKNFGSSQGTSFVTIGGGQADNYPEWSDTKICFQLGANAVTGNIVAVIGGVSSNGIPFTVRSGNIYFVNPSSPANPGTGTYADPFRSPLSFCNLIEAGENGATCYFRAGTYSGEYAHSGWHSNFCLSSEDGHAGVSGQENAFIGYPGETAIIQASGSLSICFRFRDDESIDCQYIVISKLKLVATSCCVTPLSNTRVIGNYCQGISEYSAAGVIDTKGNNIFIYGNEITGGSSANKLDHAIYPKEGANVQIGWNYIHDNNFAEGPMISINHDAAWTSGWTFKIYVHDNIIDMSDHPSRALGVFETGSSSSVWYYNNIVIGPSYSGENAIYGVSANLYYYNNTFYNLGSSSAAVFNFYGTSENGHSYRPLSITMKNNIVYANSNAKDYMERSADLGMPTPTNDHNCWYNIGTFAAKSSGTCGTNANAVEGDPKFLNAATKDFSLQASSPCIDKGADVSSVVTKDYNGLSRPDNSIYDMGAYEYDSNNPPEASITTISLCSATVGEVYLETFQASGGTNPYTWAILSGSLPTGLSLAGSSGVISGTPFSSGTSFFIIQVTDNNSQTVVKSFSITVNLPGTTGSSSVSNGGGGGGGGGGGCFIASAVYGDNEVQNIRILERFRDRYLLTNKCGKTFVSFYYKVSPAIAKYIKKRDWSCFLTKKMLQPIVWLAKNLLKDQL